MTSRSHALYISPYYSRTPLYKKTCLHYERYPTEKMALGDDELKPSMQKTTSHPLLKKTYSYSVSSSTITCLSIANQSRAANPNRQSSKVASINTSRMLSQLQPIRRGTYVAKLQHAPRGYANVEDLPRDLPSFYHANHVGVISCVRKSRGILAQCVHVNASLL